jgi:hypothetical protein
LAGGWPMQPPDVEPGSVVETSRDGALLAPALL